MRQITLNEAQIQKAVLKVLREMDFSSMQPKADEFANLERNIDEMSAEIQNQIEVLENKQEQLGSVIPAFQEVNSLIKKFFPNIQGPQVGKYGDSFAYVFAEPYEYNEEEDSYGVVDNIEETIKDEFPENIREAISVYAKDDKNNNYARTGFEISISLDDLNGWI